MNTSSDISGLDGCSVKVVDAGRVEAVRERMPAAQELADTAEIFGLLSDPGRLRLLVALLDGELCVCDLAAVTGQSESAASHALRLLRAHRVVAVRRSGRMAYYRLADPHVRMLLDLAIAHAEHTDPTSGHAHPDPGPALRSVSFEARGKGL
ncbi:ArsR/SmtB family transcription factor [Nonomuraea solani]|nr:metalloregulator ArsR/SmtB family transcription factor [Nonomuraea solani]